MVDFGEDVVVFLGQYFWSRKEREVIKKGTKRSREENTMYGFSLDQIICRMDSFDIRKGALDTVASMGSFVGDNFNSVFQLKKYIEEKEQELQRSKQYEA